jgi:hypothetical protein
LQNPLGPLHEDPSDALHAFHMLDRIASVYHSAKKLFILSDFDDPETGIDGYF